MNISTNTSVMTPDLTSVTETITDGTLPEVTEAATEQYDMTTAKQMHFITSTIFGSIFVIIGLVGNVLSILVWKRKKMRSSTGTYLIGQAIADIGVLLFFFITDSVPMMAPVVNTSTAYGAFFSFVGYPIFFLAVVCSIWFTVGVTVDRYIQVCWITKAKEWCNVKRAWLGLGIITLFCFIVNSPHFATFEPVLLRSRNATDPAFRKTEFGASSGSVNYEFWVHCMFLVLVPWAAIFSLNMLIIRRISSMNKQMDDKRGSMGKAKAKKAETQLTRLLLTVTFTFLVLIAFQCITQCFFMLKAGNMQIVSEAFSIAKLGIVINSSINFFLYCLSGKRFRDELRHVVCSRVHGHGSLSSSYSLTNSTASSGISRTKSGLSTTTSLKV